MQAMIPFENLLNQVWFMSWKNLVLQFWLEMLLANQIAVFFDHQFLWRELIIPQIFCMKIIIKWENQILIMIFNNHQGNVVCK